MKQPAQRVVTLAPFLTEIAFAAGAGDKVVGVSAHSDYPVQARKLPRVSTAAGFSIEQIAALRPDLVLVWRDSVRAEDIERITRFGAPVFVASARHLDDVPRLLDIVGRLAASDAAAVAATYRRKLDALRRANSAKRPLTAFLEIWNRPLTTIAGRHFMNEALETCGARNVFAHLDGVAPRVSWEDVYAKDPDVVVGTGSAGSAEEFRANWRARTALRAVKGERLVFLDADTIERPGPRLVEGIAQLCDALDRIRSAVR